MGKMTLTDRIITLLTEKDGLTDREITDILLGKNNPQQSVNQACRNLANRGLLRRVVRKDGLIGNFLTDDGLVVNSAQGNDSKITENTDSKLKEDYIKEVLQAYLHSEGWETQIAWGKTPGIDINAIRGNERWIIEVKGLGTSNPMNVNYFLGVLAETLQRMEDPNAKYSIALPDVKQFRNLWDRLPLLAKKRTGITALFIDEQGNVSECL
ncbi:MarR family transcriptional regulator [Geobacillus thermoleovorans]|nr:hypothetical protein IB49_11200 [Geobacillus sp. LC300]ASS87589.1 MarR family transcriptional regulator [Geobacillus lituanicus]NNV00471.1 MarR family transcriptional regulator [Geobacillus sp. DSP4a]PJW15305.1 MarR family transcriptional regulator [Geobacillus sp. Manikaran-105]QDY71918.1 MarR family transcriptional regulator [Geobacillus thermoleovorans]QHN48102.1 MarR family transcriptional regulator [Geobacillus stearothermophilus]